ncbi:MAG: cysteine desulfurase [Ruminococcaceae bacterium]|nr:cysteine desulfurase [Oscillospiraceae bacterium]
MENNREIYLDNSATTKTTKAVNDSMIEVLEKAYANPSSLHNLGMKAEKAFESAKQTLADCLSCTKDEIYITSGGTESNNLAIFGYLEAAKRKGKHIICTGVEHPAVYEAVEYAKTQGYEADILGADKNGYISLDEFESLLREDTVLVCVMHVNNEVGAIMPIEKLKPIMKKKATNAALFVDAVQSFGKIAIKPSKIGVDMMSASAHKIHGPKGVGLLYIKKGVRVLPILHGGHQQSNLRSGTQNVFGTVGFATAASEAYKNIDKNYEHVSELKNRLYNRIVENIDNVVLNGDESALPYILNVSFIGIKSEILLHALESRGIYVSTGSACASNAPSPSRTLLCMGKDKKEIEGAVRFSFSAMNTKEEIDYTIKVLTEEVKNIRKYVRG